MKIKTIVAILLLIGVMGVAYVYSSNNDSNTKNTINNSSPDVDNQDLMIGSYDIDTEKSVVNWTGKKPKVSGYTDHGIIKLSRGQVVISPDKEFNAEFVFDMNTIKATSTGFGAGQDRLTAHLKSEDFFSVDSHGESVFAVDSIENIEGDNMYNLNGTLTIKDISNNISVPSVIFVDDNGVLRIKSQTEIDRTNWNIRYGSDSFFDNLADNVISNYVAVELDIYATEVN